MDLSQLQADPTFMSLPFTEKVKAMAMIDRQFAALSPEDQHRGLAMVFPPDPREVVAERKLYPSATARGDPNANPLTAGDIAGAAAGAAVKGLARMAGIPTSIEEVPGAAKTLLLNALTMGGYGMTKTEGQLASDVSGPARAYLSGQAPSAEQNAAAVPIIGRPAMAVAGPVLAVAQGNAPPDEQNLSAVSAGTQLAATAAMMHPAVGAAIERAAPSAGAALEQSGNATYADALAAKGSELHPLAETIGSQLAKRGTVMSNPAEQLRTQFGGSAGEAATVQKFRKPSAQGPQLQALQDKYPDATVAEDAGNYILHKPQQDKSLNQQAADTLAAAAPKHESIVSYKDLRNEFYGGMAGAGAGFLFGGPVGAAVGGKLGSAMVTAVEAPMIVGRLIKSPLWKTTSGSIKSSLGRAMQAQDFPVLTSIAARVLAGQNLEDSYGHDQALYDLVQSLPPELQSNPQALNQELQQYYAVYVGPDSNAVSVPYHVQQQTVKKMTTGR